MSLAGVPSGIDVDLVEGALAQLEGVETVHDLHVWPLSTTETALTAHLVVPGGHPGDGFLHDLAHDLAHDFGIGHATVQVETEAECVLTLPESNAERTANSFQTGRRSLSEPMT